MPTSDARPLHVAWHVSTFSADGGGGDCVEAGPVLDGTGRIAVRHSQHPEGPAIIYTRTEWGAFISGVRAGEFDFTNLIPT
ncbi:DUF397 domain-containing protein [Sphaerisporangium sp. NBC_01403]|uniref:DUF397 domain-containing protein n=1 Tax=Sphaerisporangium sp. NBC_01403 TaxID=2903599 RepID=UPI00324D4751